MGDAPKAQCATCHNGVYKPLYGLQMAKHYPAFWGTRTDWTSPLPPKFTTPVAAQVAPDSGAVVVDTVTMSAVPAARVP